MADGNLRRDWTVIWGEQSRERRCILIRADVRAQGKALIEQALRLHERGNHDGAVAETDEAGKVIRARLIKL